MTDAGVVRPVGTSPAGTATILDRRSHLQELHLELSAAATVAQVAAAVSTGLRNALGASVVTVCTSGNDGTLRTADVAGYPRERLGAFATIPLSAPLPLTDAARLRQPVWLVDRAATVAAYPPIAASLLPGTEALVALPLTVADRLVGALGVTFLHPLALDDGERAFLLEVAGQVAIAVERAGLADAQREMAETLQRSLLPGALPDIPGIAIAARYVPADVGTSAGGDWYDALVLDDGRMAVTVGDVVGHGAAAAAVMGQLRSALTTLLLAGFGPARALQLLDRFAARVPGALVATAACAVLDQETHRLTYSSAGHPPMLVVDGDGGTYVGSGTGPALGVARSAPRREVRWQLDATSTVLLYTDGLVETRGATLDDGLARLAEVAARHRTASLAELVDGVLDSLLDPGGASDDVAVVAVRLLPEPLHLDEPAIPAVLSRIRRSAGAWARASGLPAGTVEDLQLALGEAVGNAAEHAYRDAAAPGRLTVRLALRDDGAAVAEVADQGTWRPPPADPGHRGRGLQMVSSLAADVDLTSGAAGTTVRFALPPLPRPAGEAPGARGPVEPEQPARLTVTRRGAVTRVAVTGDLDQVGVVAVGDALRQAVAGGTPVRVDVTGLGWLTSVGIGLLLDVARTGEEVTFDLPAAGRARHALDLTGVTPVLADTHRAP